MNKTCVLDPVFAANLQKLLVRVVRIKDLNALLTINVDPIPMYLNTQAYYAVSFDCLTESSYGKPRRLRSQSIKNRKKVQDFLKESYMLTKPLLRKKEVEYHADMGMYSQSRGLVYRFTLEQLNILYGLLKIQCGSI